MAVIGSRANGTRVPDDAVKGGGFGAALLDSGGVRNPQPASERRDVTILGRPGFGVGGRRPLGKAEDRDPAPLDARSSLLVASTLDRARREWFETLDENEKALDPLAASGFAAGIAQQFRDFSSKTLADMPESLRPHVASGLSRVGGELEMRARDFEDMAGQVGIFNRTKQTLDDLTATVGIERFDAPRVLREGRARIAAAPLGDGARRILGDYFLADLPLKTALAHIDDDPDDALVALRATERGAGPKIPAPGSLADGVDGEDGQFDPAMLYAGLAPEVRSGLEAQARIISVRRKQGARLATIRRIEQGIDANSVSTRDIERAGLDRADTAHLKAKLDTARADEQLTADAVERFVNKPESIDRSKPEDQRLVDLAYAALVESDDVDRLALAEDVLRRSGILPRPAVDDLTHIAQSDAGEESVGAAALLEVAGFPPPEKPEDEPSELPQTADELSFEDSGAPGLVSPIGFDLRDEETPQRLVEQYPLLAGQPAIVRGATQTLIADLFAAGVEAREIDDFLAGAESEIRRRSETAAVPVAIAAGIGAVALIAAIDHWRQNKGPERTGAAISKAFENARANLEETRGRLLNSDTDPQDGMDGTEDRDGGVPPVPADVKEIKRSLRVVKKELENVEAKARDRPTENVAVFRIEGETNRRLEISGSGTVRIVGGNRRVLWIHLGDKRRALEFLEKRLLGKKPLSDAKLKSFEVPKAFVDKIENTALTEKQIDKRRKLGDDSWMGLPVQGDITKTDHAFGLRTPQIEALKGNIIQGTGRVLGP